VQKKLFFRDEFLVMTKKKFPSRAKVIIAAHQSRLYFIVSSRSSYSNL